MKRPELYGQLMYLFYQRVNPHRLEDTRTQSTEWCKARAVSSTEAIERITGKRIDTPLHELFPSFFAQAEEVVRSLPVQMGGGADLDLLYYLSEFARATVAVETGVAYGWSSSAILLSMRNRLNAVLHSTDMPYPKLDNDPFVGSVVPGELRQFWKIIHLPDRQALPGILRQVSHLDLCHYDSDKSYRGRMWAYPRIWNALRPGGIFISDDINDNVAFSDFSAMVKAEPIVVFNQPEQKYIGILIKGN